MGFAPSAIPIWPVTPDWGSSVVERLQFATDVMHASATAVSHHRSYRIGPRRSFSFSVLAGSQERRVADMLIAGHSSVWLMPIWPDVQWLAAGLSSAVEEIPCATAGFDFVVGGKALLYSSVNRWEVVEIDAIEADRLVLTGPTTSLFNPGDRLYPLRRARLQTGAEEAYRSADVSRRPLAFDIDEPTVWPALVDLTSYLTHMVLDVRPDESTDPTASYERLLQSVDYEASLPFVYDLPAQALRAQKTAWKLFGREQHSWFRSLLHTLDGRRVPLWVPSFASDLKPAASIAGGSTSLSVEWAGYTQFGKGKHNRKDVRIELNDGAVFCRRITDAVEAGVTETLTLSSSLSGSSIAPGRIRAISFMALSTLASDDFEIEHVTDQEGLATCTTGWQAVVPDV